MADTLTGSFLREEKGFDIFAAFPSLDPDLCDLALQLGKFLD